MDQFDWFTEFIVGVISSSLCRQHQASSGYLRLSRWSVTPSPTASHRTFLHSVRYSPSFLKKKQIVGLFKSLGGSGTPDNCEWRPHGRVQVQLRARTACLACSTISMVFEWFSSFEMSCSLTKQVAHADVLRSWKETTAYKDDVYLSPKEIDG